MVNQLGKFSSRISELTQPLQELLSTKQAWVWGQEQEKAFGHVKEELLQPMTLASTVQPPSRVALSFGFGAVLFSERQRHKWKPVIYASRSMSETERRYAQIKNKALAVM